MQDHHQHARSLTVKPLDSYLLYSNMGSLGHYTDFILENWQDQISLTSNPTDLDICVKHTAPLSNVWKISDLQCMCESSYSLRVGKHFVKTHRDT